MTVAAERIARQTRRDYCRGCTSATLHPFAGWVTDDGRENTIRPRAYYRTCRECGLLVMVLDDVTDVEGLARSVLDRYLRQHGGAATATTAPFGPPPLNWEAALFYLVDVAWQLYEKSWNPSYGDGRVTFRGYATQKMQLKLNSWILDESGDASDRTKGRVWPKAHAPSVSTSLDELLEPSSHDAGDARPKRRASMGGSDNDPSPVAAALAGRTGNAADDRSPDLARALEARSR